MKRKDRYVGGAAVAVAALVLLPPTPSPQLLPAAIAGQELLPTADLITNPEVADIKGNFRAIFSNI